MNINNIFLKKALFWALAAVLIVVISMVVALGINPINEKQYQYEFPLTHEDIESVLEGQGINMVVEDISTIDESTNGPSLNDIIISIATLRNKDNITLGISSQVRSSLRFLNMTWYLPKALSTEKVDDFFHNELSKQFELAGIFYGNKKGLNKELNKLYDYYIDGDNYNNSSYWNKRVGNDHLIVRRNNRTMSTISMMVIPDEMHEDYLNSTNEAWKDTAEAENINIHNSTISEVITSAKEYVFDENEIDIFTKHFIVKGQLKNIKENKHAPKQLVNIDSDYLMPNKEKYLSAKLVDETGSLDVFLQMTSLDNKQLGMERYHRIVMFYDNDEPIYVVRLSTLN